MDESLIKLKRFKSVYLGWLQASLQALAPSGYEVRVIEEKGYAGQAAKGQIFVYVNFGAGSKEDLANDKYIQPITLNVITEVDDFRIAQNEVLTPFVYQYSKTTTKLEYKAPKDIDDVTFQVLHNYLTPAVMGGQPIIGGQSRSHIVLTGTVVFTTNLLLQIGLSVKLDESSNEPFKPVDLLNISVQYANQALTPQFISANRGVAIKGASNIAFTIAILLDDSPFCQRLLDSSHATAPSSLLCKLSYGAKEYKMRALICAVNINSAPPTGELFLTATFMEQAYVE